MRSGKLRFRIKGRNKVLRATFKRGSTVNMNYNQYFNLSSINTCGIIINTKNDLFILLNIKAPLI